jgi:hypothetical protein
MLLALSVLLHFLVVLKLGGYHLLIDKVFKDHETVDMPLIMQMRQLNEEYTVNLETAEDSHNLIREMPVNLAVPVRLDSEQSVQEPETPDSDLSD